MGYAVAGTTTSRLRSVNISNGLGFFRYRL